MSLPNTALFHTRDILEEYNLRPWWEKLRSYAYTGSVVFALFILWLNFQWDTMACLPNAANVNLSAQLARLVNLYCYREIPFEIQFSGIIVIGTTLALFVASNVMVASPHFIGAVKTYKRAEELLEKNEEKGSRKIPTVSKELLEDLGPKSGEPCMHKLGVMYLIRNLLFVFVSGIVGSYYVVQLTHLSKDDGYLSECKLPSAHEVAARYTLGSTTTFFCSYYVGHRLFPATVAYTILVWMQCLATFIGMIWMTWCCRDPVNRNEMEFMHRMWRNSEPTASKTLANPNAEVEETSNEQQPQNSGSQ